MTIKLKGGKELEQFLRAFPKRVQNGAVRSALRAGANVIRDEAKARVPSESGKLRKAIKTGSARVHPDGSASIHVRLKGEHSYLGMFHEYGVKPHIIPGKKGLIKIGDEVVSGPIEHPGISPRPFMRPAADTKADEAVKAFADQIRNYLKAKTGFTGPTVDIEMDD